MSSLSSLLIRHHWWLLSLLLPAQYLTTVCAGSVASLLGVQPGQVFAWHCQLEVKPTRGESDLIERDPRRHWSHECGARSSLRSLFLFSCVCCRAHRCGDSSCDRVAAPAEVVLAAQRCVAIVAIASDSPAAAQGQQQTGMSGDCLRALKTTLEGSPSQLPRSLTLFPRPLRCSLPLTRRSTHPRRGSPCSRSECLSQSVPVVLPLAS